MNRAKFAVRLLVAGLVLTPIIWAILGFKMIELVVGWF